MVMVNRGHRQQEIRRTGNDTENPRNLCDLQTVMAEQPVVARDVPCPISYLSYPPSVQQEEQWIQKGRSFHPTTTSYSEQSVTILGQCGILVRLISCCLWPLFTIAIDAPLFRYTYLSIGRNH
ncbi:hypothetical protein BDC45DRAFT_529625 [Circinella umbellata]|nr:hypothetical protein BDC45DRAFT_529625 [Circinella umbellata]